MRLALLLVAVAGCARARNDPLPAPAAPGSPPAAEEQHPDAAPVPTADAGGPATAAPPPPAAPADASASGNGNGTPAVAKDAGAPDAGRMGCPSNYYICGRLCVDGTSPQACGASCTVCPPAENGTPVCRAGTCSYECPDRDRQKKCNGGCYACCSDADCAPKTGITGRCQDNACVYACPGIECSDSCRQVQGACEARYIGSTNNGCNWLTLCQPDSDACPNPPGEAKRVFSGPNDLAQLKQSCPAILAPIARTICSTNAEIQQKRTAGETVYIYLTSETFKPNGDFLDGDDLGTFTCGQ